MYRARHKNIKWNYEEPSTFTNIRKRMCRFSNPPYQKPPQTSFRYKKQRDSLPTTRQNVTYSIMLDSLIHTGSGELRRDCTAI